VGQRVIGPKRKRVYLKLNIYPLGGGNFYLFEFIGRKNRIRSLIVYDSL